MAVSGDGGPYMRVDAMTFEDDEEKAEEGSRSEAEKALFGLFALALSDADWWAMPKEEDAS